MRPVRLFDDESLFCRHRRQTTFEQQNVVRCREAVVVAAEEESRRLNFAKVVLWRRRTSVVGQVAECSVVVFCELATISKELKLFEGLLKRQSTF